MSTMGLTKFWDKGGMWTKVSLVFEDWDNQQDMPAETRKLQFASSLLQFYTYVVSMSKEKLFGMCRNDEFANFHATYSYFFFKVQNWDRQQRTETAEKYHVIIQNL